MTEAEVREAHQIPEYFHGYWFAAKGYWFFTFCDATINVYPDGAASHTSMVVGECGHRFNTVPWPFAES